MGAAASKQAGRAAATAGRRQYPSSPSILNNAPSTSNAPSEYTSSNSASTIPPPSQSQSQQPPNPFAPSQVHPDPTQSPPSDSRSGHIELDGRDPQFGDALRRLGPAIAVERAAPYQAAFPTSSQPPLGQQGKNIFPTTAEVNAMNSPSTSRDGNNSSLNVVRARERINKTFDEEMENLGRKGFEGRTLLSAKDIKEVIRLRDMAGKTMEEIEGMMRLEKGVLGRLGGRRVFGNVRLD